MNKHILQIASVIVLFAFSACTDFIQIDPPRTDLIRSVVFTSDEKASAAVIDIYALMSFSGFASGDINSVSFASALSADDLTTTITYTPDYIDLQENSLNSENGVVLRLWSDAFKIIYRCNAVIEGLESSSSVTSNLKAQLAGEAKFIRAFCYFYLVNLYGDTPLVLTTDYITNSNISRSPQREVYDQILKDLTQARDLLPTDFTSAKGNRLRATRAAANTLLARTNLYLRNYDKAEEYANLVLADTQFGLVPVSETFASNNSEAILQIYPPFGIPLDQQVKSNSVIRHELLEVFDPDDQRFLTWINGIAVNKYGAVDQFLQNSVLLRLSEVYLIRAEARANTENLNGALDDVNVIRTKAGLSTIGPGDQSAIIDAILLERRKEFFAEWAHRWLDLKRLNLSHTMLSTIKTDLHENDMLYPIPYQQIQNNPAMRSAQNPGY